VAPGNLRRPHGHARRKEVSGLCRVCGGAAPGAPYDRQSGTMSRRDRGRTSESRLLFFKVMEIDQYSAREVAPHLPVLGIKS
jgi:hypothetical protein